MVPPFKRGKESEEASDAPSNNLWVGNLPADVLESDLVALFRKYGELDSLSAYSFRSYAFVYYKRVEDAIAAKKALQGSMLGGNQIKIEFARPAKPCKNLWVGGISPSISKEELEEEFQKFGKIEDFKFLKERNTAFVEYMRLENAIQAAKSMNGKRMGGEQLRVDFLRSQPSRREQWPSSYDHRDAPSSRGVGLPDSHLSAKRPLPQSSLGLKTEQLSNVLWVGYPPSVQIDEQMLHNAMILFGEIERIRSFPSRHFSLVEFRSIEEARRAKEGLQGRLFNDPRITILYSNGEQPLSKDYPGFYSGIKGSGTEMFINERSFRPPSADIFGHNHPTVGSFAGPLPPNNLLAPNVTVRPFGVQNSFERFHPGPEYNDLASNTNLMGPNWRRPSPPAPGIVPSPAQGIRPSVRPASGPWDAYDAGRLERETKRVRRDGSLTVDEGAFPITKIDDRGPGLDLSHGFGPIIDGAASGPFANAQGKGRFSPSVGKVTPGGPGMVYPDNDYIWRGIIAKGGTPVCHARCVPIGRGIGTELPEVVNCSARTGLDMLTKHYAEAIGFDIVFFLPDSEDDFASYTEFLRYLGSKNRAGVAKFDNGTTLFLVPPSDFLTKVLKVSGPERLYGVVLKLPPPVTSAVSFRQEVPKPLPSSYVDRQRIAPAEPDYNIFHRKEEQTLAMDYNRVLLEDSKSSFKPGFPHAGEPRVQLSGPKGQQAINTASMHQGGVTLTPELIATLASLLPAASQPSGPEIHPASLISSTVRPPFPQTVAQSSKETSLSGWNQDQQASDSSGHSFQQMGSHYNPQAHLSQNQHYPSVSSAPNFSAQMVLGSTQIQEPSVSLLQQAAVSSRPLAKLMISSQGSHIATSPPVNQQYQQEGASTAQKGYGVVHATDGSGVYSSQAFQLANNPGVMSNQVHSANLSQPQNTMPISVDRVNLELPSQVQQIHSVGAVDAEVDKNQRYQSTLQFAASLLQQIQQKNQPNTPAGRGTADQL